MSEFVYEHIVNADLSKPLVRKNVGMLLASGDEKANRFGAKLTRNGEDVDASSCSVVGYMIRPNDETLRITGVASGSTVYVDIPDNGYAYDGAFTLTVKVTGDGFAKAVAIFDGQIAKTTSDAIIDGDRVLYGVDDIIAQIDAMEAAEASANEAANAANTAANLATNAASNANAATLAADEAANAANTAAENAEEKANYAEATITNANNTLEEHVNESNSAAQSATESAQKALLAADTANSAAAEANTATGTLQSAMLEMQRAVNNADDAAERANNAAAVCEEIDPHPVGSIYMSVNDTSPAVRFGGTWERIEDTFLLAAGSTYEAGETGGETTHSLVNAELPPLSVTTYQASASTSSISYAGGSVSRTIVASVKNNTGSASFGGTSKAFSIMPPYLAVYIWKRVS